MYMRPLEDIWPRDETLLYVDMQFLQDMLAITAFFNTATNIQYIIHKVPSFISVRMSWASWTWRLKMTAAYRKRRPNSRNDVNGLCFEVMRVILEENVCIY